MYKLLDVASAEREPTSSSRGADDDARGVDRVLVVACFLAIAFFLLNIVLFRYGRDQGIYAVVADTMLRGGAPYRDAWDFKPPGIFLIYAGARAIFGATEHGIRVVEAFAFASLVWAFTILAKRWVGDWRAGLVAGTLAVGTEAQLEFWHTSQPESFGAVAIAWALVCVTYEPDVEIASGERKRLGAWVAAGALYTIAALLKPPLGGGFVVSLVVLVVTRLRAAPRDERARALIAPTLAFAVGGAVCLALTAAYFAAKGALGDLHETLFVFTPYYTKLGFRPQWLWGFVYMAFEQWSVGFSAFIAAGLGAFLALPALSSRERGAAAHVVAIAATQLLGVGLQAKFFPYHYGAALPLAALLAGLGGWKLWVRARGSVWGLVLLGIALYVLGDARGATRDLEDTFWGRSKMRIATLWSSREARDETNDALYSVADVNAGANRRVAEWLASHTPPDQPVYVWGFEPEIYDLAKRRPASRYVYNVPQRVTWVGGLRERLMDDLARKPPSAIVVEHRDVFPAVTGSSYDSADTLSSFPSLATKLREGYVLAERIEDFDIYVAR